MTVQSPYVRWFKDLRLKDVPLVGGKNASLGELYATLAAEGVRVPNGFALTAQAYREALAAGADVVIMVHPDYQYTPLLVTAMASMVAYGVYDVVLGSRIIGGTALRGGMPFYKYVANRLLTAVENLFLRIKLSEYHTGYRAFSRKVLTELPLLENSDDFVFDNQMLAQCAHFGFKIGEVSCPTKYFEEASSINFRRSVNYGFGVLLTTLQFTLERMGIAHFRMFSEKGRKLEPGYPTYYVRSTDTARPA